MPATLPRNSVVLSSFFRVLGGQDQAALEECIAAGLLPHVFEMARNQDQLPALAVRCYQHAVASEVLGEESDSMLRQALQDNTRRNMQIYAQAIKITARLNQAGIIPLFLKGTARLLAAGTDNLGFRKQADIDLIVKPGELKSAGDVFLADGYSYLQFSKNPAIAPRRLGDTVEAIKLSEAHHHLPPLAKDGYAATVELHRHFLDSRFQRANPLQPLFDCAHQYESHGVTFRVPSAEYRIIHLVLGKLVTDGHLARRTFPVREACDLIELLEETGQHEIEWGLIKKRCGTRFSLFLALVTELMAYRSGVEVAPTGRVTSYIWMMQKRYDSRAAGRLLDLYARAGYLLHALLYSPAKFPAYLHGVISSGR